MTWKSNVKILARKIIKIVPIKDESTGRFYYKTGGVIYCRWPYGHKVTYSNSDASAGYTLPSPIYACLVCNGEPGVRTVAGTPISMSGFTDGVGSTCTAKLVNTVYWKNVN